MFYLETTSSVISNLLVFVHKPSPVLFASWQMVRRLPQSILNLILNLIQVRTEGTNSFANHPEMILLLHFVDVKVEHLTRSPSVMVLKRFIRNLPHRQIPRQKCLFGMLCSRLFSSSLNNISLSFLALKLWIGIVTF